ncbi:MAG: protein-export chaperone SecB [Clostridia bacterium]|jgi:preprotein translocase subunit SecB|nr:protein-export chaperone SecB [Clostridia bacterium]
MEEHIRLTSFRVNEMQYKFHEGIQPGTRFQIKPKIECKMGRKDKTLFVNLSVKVNEDISSPVPFDIHVAMFGTFNVIEEEDQKVFIAEAVETLYPYLRAMVASVTANCNIPAYMLPPINPTAIASGENPDVGNENLS